MCKCGQVDDYGWGVNKECTCGQSRTPHKHAAVIKAWADGATIQERDDTDPTRWYNTLYPNWSERAFFRIKPVLRPMWQVARDGFFDGQNTRTSEGVWTSVVDAVIKEWLARNGE